MYCTLDVPCNAYFWGKTHHQGHAQNIIQYSMQCHLQVWQFSMYQSRPRALLPPLFHAINPLPQGLFIHTVYLVFSSIHWSPFPLCYFQCRFVFSPDQQSRASESKQSYAKKAYFSNSSNSRRSGKNRRGSSTAKMPRAARNRNESPSSTSTSQSRAQASNGR